MRFQFFVAELLIGLCLLGLSGCGKGPAGEKAGGEHAEEEHAHDLEGPHGGHIIELGAESHHAELMHDEATHKVGIYLLGGDAKTAAPIDATKVTINVSEDSKPSQY